MSDDLTIGRNCLQNELRMNLLELEDGFGGMNESYEMGFCLIWILGNDSAVRLVRFRGWRRNGALPFGG